MKLGYFTMPLHPADRGWTQTLQEDREAIILADRLGFEDAFVGEHLTDRYETITNSMVFLATLIHETERIRLATGTTNLSHTHPALVAVNAAMLDHLSGGRFILGVSPGALRSDAELLGILDEDRNVMFADALDAILRLWSEDPPYDIVTPGGRFHISTARTINDVLGIGAVRRPLQTPRPEIVGTVVAPFSKGVIEMGKRDLHPLSANFLLPQWLRSHWDNYALGAEEAGRIPRPDEWRVARTIFVADDENVALEYGRRSPRSPYRFYYDKILAKFRSGGRVDLFKSDRSMPDEAVTTDTLLDELVICGTPSSVAEQLLRLREEAGGFGELVYAGIDWADPELARRSMQLMATKVLDEIARTERVAV